MVSMVNMTSTRTGKASSASKMTSGWMKRPALGRRVKISLAAKCAMMSWNLRKGFAAGHKMSRSEVTYCRFRDREHCVH